MARKVAPLSDAQCRAAKPRDKDYKLFDGNGLYLLVKVNGSRIWRYKYTKPDGREGLTSFGHYPGITLAMARKQRDEARLLLLQGRDPIQQKLVTRRDAENARRTFEAVALEWHQEMSRKWTPQYSGDVLVRLRDYLFPVLGHRAIAELDTSDLLVPVEMAKKRGTYTVARRLQQYMQCIMRDAKRARLIDSNPALDLVGAVKPQKVTHRPALPPQELPELLARIDAYRGNEITRIAVLLKLHMFVRSSELRFARWQEIDFDRALWEIPDTRKAIPGVRFSTRGTKMAGDIHLVPLSPQVLALLKRLKAISGRQALLFPGEREASRPLSENTINKALRIMGYDTRTELCGHGFRTMACSALVESGLWSPEAIERQMSHRERNSVRAAYIHKAEFIEQRRLIMDWWSNYLDANRGGQVSPYEYANFEDRKVVRLKRG